MSKNDVLICGEILNGSLDVKTLELLGIGKKLASDIGVNLSVALIGHKLTDIADEAAFFGADIVYKLESPLLGTFNADLWVEVLEKLCRQINPKVLLMLHSFIGMEVAPRLAFRLNTALTTDCVNLEVDQEDGLLLRTKPVYGGNVLFLSKYKGTPQFVTVRAKVTKPVDRISTKGEVRDIAIEIDESMSKVESISIVKEKTVALDKADVIVAGGRGLGGIENLEYLEALANALKKSFGKVLMACSRPVVDSGWMSSDRQIGLTGATVSPALYVAVAISGAIQHIGGMIGSEKIVAINIDPNSNIFSVSDYGVVGDFQKVIPAFIKKWEGLQ